MPAAPDRSVTLTGSVVVNRPPQTAIDLFTAEGERVWVEGWDPTYPDPGLEDATEPGAVWQTTRREGAVTWVVAGRTPPEMRYVFFVENLVAGMVTVVCEADGAGSIARVRYDATALAPEGEAYLRALASGFDDEMRGWAAAIADLPADAPGEVRKPRHPSA
jgi:hypothetical protein